MTTNIGAGFRNADSELFGKLVRCLDFANDLPFFKAYKAHSWEQLNIEPRQVVLDVACGTGSDLIQLAARYPATRFIGVDKSENFLAVAKERAGSTPNVEFLPGDAERLPLNDATVDARADRSLPCSMWRPLRPSSRTWCASPKAAVESSPASPTGRPSSCSTESSTTAARSPSFSSAPSATGSSGASLRPS